MTSPPRKPNRDRPLVTRTLDKGTVVRLARLASAEGLSQGEIIDAAVLAYERARKVTDPGAPRRGAAVRA